MLFQAATIPGAFVIDLERVDDARGYFARAWCRRQASEHGIDADFVQLNLSGNRQRGIVRGLHWSVAPSAEAKVVRCVRGAIWDVMVDMRRESPAFARWQAVELSAGNQRMVFLPPGVAHGYQTLSDDCEVLYQMSTFYDASCARGLRWDDPRLAIPWPIADPQLSDRDRELPFLHQCAGAP